MSEIISTQSTFTGLAPNIDIASISLDDDDNTFTHIAIHKGDLQMLQWMIQTEQPLPYNKKNVHHQTPFDVCIHQLSPTLPHTTAQREIAHEILDIITKKYDQGRYTLDYRKKFLSQIVRLQLEHKKTALDLCSKKCKHKIQNKYKNK